MLENKEFLKKYCKIMISKLDNAGDKERMSAWLNMISECEDTQNETSEMYLELLLWALHTNRINVYPFKFRPPVDDEGTSDSYKFALEMIKFKPENNEDGEVKAVVSDDLKEYFSVQKIPGFGTHCFYGFSNDEPISTWDNVPKMKANVQTDLTKESAYWMEIFARPANSSIEAPKSTSFQAKQKEENEDNRETGLEEKSTQEFENQEKFDEDTTMGSNRDITCPDLCKVEKILQNLSFGGQEPQNVRSIIEKESPECSRRPKSQSRSKDLMGFGCQSDRIPFDKPQCSANDTYNTSNAGYCDPNIRGNNQLRGFDRNKDMFMQNEQRRKFKENYNKNPIDHSCITPCSPCQQPRKSILHGKYNPSIPQFDSDMSPLAHSTPIKTARSPSRFKNTCINEVNSDVMEESMKFYPMPSFNSKENCVRSQQETFCDPRLNTSKTSSFYDSFRCDKTLNRDNECLNTPFFKPLRCNVKDYTALGVKNSERIQGIENQDCHSYSRNSTPIKTAKSPSRFSNKLQFVEIYARQREELPKALKPDNPKSCFNKSKVDDLSKEFYKFLKTQGQNSCNRNRSTK